MWIILAVASLPLIGALVLARTINQIGDDLNLEDVLGVC